MLTNKKVKQPQKLLYFFIAPFLAFGIIKTSVIADAGFGGSADARRGENNIDVTCT